MLRQFRQQIAGGPLGPAVHRCAVDHPSAGLEENTYHLAQRLPCRYIILDVQSSSRVAPGPRENGVWQRFSAVNRLFGLSTPPATSDFRCGEALKGDDHRLKSSGIPGMVG